MCEFDIALAAYYTLTPPGAAHICHQPSSPQVLCLDVSPQERERKEAQIEVISVFKCLQLCGCDTLIDHDRPDEDEVAVKKTERKTNEKKNLSILKTQKLNTANIVQARR